jgi:hypothetical protein
MPWPGYRPWPRGAGWRLQLHRADGGLAELVELVGLGEVVHLCPGCSATGPGGPS